MKGGNWVSSIHRGKGGVSSIVEGRTSKSFFYAICVFSIKNILKALKP